MDNSAHMAETALALAAVDLWAHTPGGWTGPGGGGLGVGRGPPPTPLLGAWGRPLLPDGSPDVRRASVLDVCSDAESVGGKQGS